MEEKTKGILVGVLAVFAVAAIAGLALAGPQGEADKALDAEGVERHHCAGFVDADGDRVCDNQDICEKHDAGGCGNPDCPRHKGENATETLCGNPECPGRLAGEPGRCGRKSITESAKTGCSGCQGEAEEVREGCPRHRAFQ